MKNRVHGLNPTGFTEDIEHGGVSEVVVFESLDLRSPIEKEPSFLHRRMSFQDTVDNVRIPSDAEMWELLLSRFPSGVLEDVIDVGYNVSCVNLWIWGALCFHKFGFLEESLGVGGVSRFWTRKSVK